MSKIGGAANGNWRRTAGAGNCPFMGPGWFGVAKGTDQEVCPEPAFSRLLEFLHFARARANRGAGAFACQPRTRPMPGMWIRCQAGADWVVLDIVNQTVQFRLIAHTMEEGFILPEGLPRSAQDQVGLSRCRTFQPTHNHR